MFDTDIENAYRVFKKVQTVVDYQAKETEKKSVRTSIIYIHPGKAETRG